MPDAYRDALVERLQRAAEATDVGEAVAVLKESAACGDAFVACCTLEVLLTWFAFMHEPAELLKPRCNAMLEAGGVAAVASALGEAFRYNSLVYKLGSTLLVNLVRCAMPGAQEAVVAAARIGLMTQPGQGDWFATSEFNGKLVTRDSCCTALALLLGCALEDVVTGMAFCAEAVASGAIERLLGGSAPTDELSIASLRVLEYFCDADASCAERIAALISVDTVLAAIATSELKLVPVGLLCRLVHCPMSPATAEKFMTREASIFKTLITALAGSGRRDAGLAVNICVAFMDLALPPWRRAAGQSRRCEPRLAAAAVDGIIAALRTAGVVTALPTPELPASAAVNAALALKAFMGGCGGADAIAPGTYLLRAGALPVLEKALAHVDAVEAALAKYRVQNIPSGGPVALGGFNARESHLEIENLINTLRALAARADAAAAELIAEEEASAALSKAKASKASSKGKGGKAAKAAKAAKKQPPAPPPAAAASSVDAVPPPPAAAASPAATPAPPELPPWLLDAMQRLPPPSAAAPQPPPSALPPVAAPRQLDTSDGSCAICLDAPAVLRTRCCAKQGPVFCEPCAALLAGVTRCALCGVDATELSGAGTAER